MNRHIRRYTRNGANIARSSSDTQAPCAENAPLPPAVRTADDHEKSSRTRYARRNAATSAAASSPSCTATYAPRRTALAASVRTRNCVICSFMVVGTHFSSFSVLFNKKPPNGAIDLRHSPTSVPAA